MGKPKRVKWVLRHEKYGKRPWDVQAEALRRKGDRARFGYFLEQGLGKTALTLNDFMTSDQTVMLVIAPNSFKLDWKYAPAEWGIGEDVWAGCWPKDKVPWDQDRAIYSVNYEAMRGGAFEKLKDLCERRKVMLVFDESAEFKNHQSMTARCAIELAKRANEVRLLNGTPIVQNVMDYYPQLRALGELNGWNPYAFRGKFAVMGGYMNKQVKGVKNEEQLYEILNRCSFRALKADWRKDLPPKVYTPVHLEMTNRQLKQYLSMMQDFFASVQGLDVTADMVLTQMDKLRQISSCLAMQDGKHEWIEKPKDNPKFRATLDIIGSGSGKTIVVHYYKPTGRMLVDEFKRLGLKPAYIQGQTPDETTVRQKEMFNQDPDCRVIVCQQTAAFRGHTLLGQPGDRASKMVFFENSFSYYHRSQMEDRNHRGEQDETCQIFDLITSPIDEKYISVLRAKKDLADAIDEIVKSVRAWNPRS